MTADLKERTCVFWVNSFFENKEDKKNPRSYSIHRKDEKMIPLAAYYHIQEEPEHGTAFPSFSISTRDQYPLVAETGHDRSPGVLPQKHFMDWMDTSIDVYDRLLLISETPPGEYIIDQVERSSVTKRTNHTTEPIEGGKALIVGELQ